MLRPLEHRSQYREQGGPELMQLLERAATSEARGTAGHAKPAMQAMLLQLVQRVIRGKDEEFAPDFLAAVEWNPLLRLARRHQVAPLLHRALQGADGIPASVQHELANSTRMIVAHNLALAAELAEILDVLEKSDIQAVPFKGPIWTEMLYGQLALRQITDLDLLVERHEVARASSILLGRGYRLLRSASEVIVHKPKDLEFAHPNTGIQVELHWSACEESEDRRLARRKLWEPQSQVLFQGRSVPVPSPANMLVLLALHGFRDDWQFLKWLIDVSMFVEVFRDLDWDRLLNDAAGLQRQRLILVPLALAERLLGTVLPAEVARAIANCPAVRQVAAQIERRYYSAQTRHPDELPGTVRDRLHREWMRIQMSDSCLERLWLHVRLLAKLFPPNQKDRAVFTRKLPAPVYWLVRPYRLLREYGVPNSLGLGRRFIDRSPPACTRNPESELATTERC